jgi:predicted histidine transporter YuiF (NhaC family)
MNMPIYNSQVGRLKAEGWSRQRLISASAARGGAGSAPSGLEPTYGLKMVHRHDHALKA